jgi:hypothetical protein
MLNQFKIDGDLAIISLSKGYFAKVFIRDLSLISSLKWRPLVRPRTVYAIANYKIDGGIFKTVYMHRLISFAPKGLQVDHIDADGLNNLSSNLRIVTASQNQMNMRKHTKKTGLKGAYYHKRDQRWISQITINRKHVYLGCFDNELDAHNAYCAASKIIHGEFGRTQ